VERRCINRCRRYHVILAHPRASSPRILFNPTNPIRCPSPSSGHGKRGQRPSFRPSASFARSSLSRRQSLKRLRGVIHWDQRNQGRWKQRTAEKRRDTMRNRIASRLTWSGLVMAAWGGMSWPTGASHATKHVLPNNNHCPRLRLCATIRTSQILPNNNTLPQSEAPHRPTLYITVNLPQVATAAPGQPGVSRASAMLHHASRSRARSS
jgi:hypothetical protein